MNLFAVREDESASGPSLRAFRICFLFAAIVLLTLAGTLELSWPQQAVMAIVTVLLAMWIDRASTSYLATLTLIFVSIFTTFRYGYWRTGTVAALLRTMHSPKDPKEWLQIACVLALLFAEAFAALTLLLGYLQTIWPLRRMPLPLSDDPKTWPAVDVLIPVMQQPLSVIRYTALAAANIDWPAAKLHIHLLDDEERNDLRAFADSAGIGYIRCHDHAASRADALNSALQQLSSPFLAIFNGDEVPTRSFLQVTMGWFLRDQALGALQTPQHRYSPDPFDRNLGQFRTVPSEDELFYGIQQDGSDFWNATLFCGSCAVLRRAALDDVGGFASETLTADVHTSLRLQSRGWRTAYINIPQAAGLATASLNAYVKERVTQARGMAQILRRENPLFAGGLTLAQRICYFHGIVHVLSALPRLIFLLAPLLYLTCGIEVLPGAWAAILAFALPHLLLSNVANSRIQGEYRHSFWSEIYETILAPYLLFPTLFAFLRPSSARNEASSKTVMIAEPHFDGRRALPFLLAAALQLFGLIMGGIGLAHDVSTTGHQNNTMLAGMYMSWALCNLVILGVCTMVAWESPQRRSTVRLAMAVPVDVTLDEGTLADSLSADISISGVALRIDESLHVRQGEQVHLTFRVIDNEAVLPATVMHVDAGILRAKFDPLTLDQEEALTRLLYSRADTWLGWADDRTEDQPLRSMQHILALAFRGFWRTVSGAGEAILPYGGTKLATNIANLVLLAAVFIGLTAAAAQFHASTLRSAGQRFAPQEVASADTKADGAQLKSIDPQNSMLPFFNIGTNQTRRVSIVFLSEPSRAALKTAGIVASWLGATEKESLVTFQVSFGSVPPGSAIVIVENAGDMPAWNISAEGPSVSIRPNPTEANANVLVISGNSGEETVSAATSLTVRGISSQAFPQFDQDLPADPHAPTVSAPETSEEMPDLQRFGESGFPFTDPTDLSETAVVLPERLTPELVELYLATMFRFGAATGSPGLHVSVVNPDGVRHDHTRNYLVFDVAGVPGDLPDGSRRSALRPFSASLPILVQSGHLRLHDRGSVFMHPQHTWWRTAPSGAVAAQVLGVGGIMPDALIQEAEWPAGSRRSVVAITLRDANSAAALVSALSDRARWGDLAGSISVLQNGRFTSYSVGPKYLTGVISAWSEMETHLADFPWILVLINFAIAFLSAIAVRSMLRQRARARFLVSA